LWAALVLMTTLGATGASWAGYREIETRRATQQAKTELERSADLTVDLEEFIKFNDGLLVREQHTEALRLRVLAALDRAGRELRHAGSDNPEIQRLTGRVSFLRGNVFLLLGETEAAKEAYELSLTEWQRLSEDFPDQALPRCNLVRCLEQLGALLFDSNHFDEAQTRLARAVELSRELVAAFPDDPACQDVLAISLYHQGRLLRNQGVLRTRAALKNQQQATQQALVLFEQAQSALGDSVELLEQRKERSPDDQAVLYSLARTRDELAFLWQNRGHPHESKAEPAYRAALPLYESLVKRFPRVAEYRQKRARCRSALGRFLTGDFDEMHFGKAPRLVDAQRFGEASDLFRQALTDQQRLAADFPTVPIYRAELADSHLRSGKLLEKMRRPGEAEENYRAARALYLELVKVASTESYLNSLAEVSHWLGHFRLLARDHLDEACSLLDEAIRYQEQARVVGNDHPRHHRALFEHHREKAEVLLAMGSHARVAQAAQVLPASIPEDHAGYLHAGFFLARCVPLVKKDDHLSPAQKDELAESYSRAAVQMLARAVEKGYRARLQLEKDPRLLPLRSRPDFQNVLEQLGAKK
jgi:tetratricopeptide (TPR) repeat protein